MSWAAAAIAELQAGREVIVRPRGNSMRPRIVSGQEVRLIPPPAQLEKGQVVLCRVHGMTYLHLIKAVGSDGKVLIGNNHGGINGWASCVYGLAPDV